MYHSKLALLDECIWNILKMDLQHATGAIHHETFVSEQGTTRKLHAALRIYLQYEEQDCLHAEQSELSSSQQ